MNLLCVSAFEPELTRFRDLAPPWIRIEPSGIGLVECALGTAELLARHSPAEAIFLGTCGSARRFLAIGDVVVATSVALVPGIGAAMIGPAEIGLPTDPALLSALAALGAKPASVANTLGVTTTSELAGHVAGLADVEHLEAYAFVRACGRANVPCAVVLGVANDVGERGRAEWQANHVAVAARASEIHAQAISRRSTTAP
jgi:nucleoside phosphorylase